MGEVTSFTYGSKKEECCLKPRKIGYLVDDLLRYFHMNQLYCLGKLYLDDVEIRYPTFEVPDSYRGKTFAVKVASEKPSTHIELLKIVMSEDGSEVNMYKNKGDAWLLDPEKFDWILEEYKLPPVSSANP